MKKLPQCIGFSLVFLLSGCIDESSPDKDGLAEHTYLYADMEVASGYLSASYVEALTFGDIWIPSSEVSDGILSGKNRYTSSDYFSFNGSCDDEYDWKAEPDCRWSVTLNGRYLNGADISLRQTLGEADVVSTFAFEELPALTSPLNDEVYSSSDTLVVNWPVGFNGWQAQYIRFIPCTNQTFGYYLHKLDEDDGSYPLAMDEVIRNCGLTEGELSVEVGYTTSGSLDERLAGGRFRVRVYSEPTVITVTL